jgi:phage tail sheath protein FI
VQLLMADLALPEAVTDETPVRTAKQWQAVQDILKTDAQWTDKLTAEINASDKTEDQKKKLLEPAALKMAVETHKALLNKSLVASSGLFGTILGEVKNRLNLLPPAAAMAGIYTMVDNTRGVWKAPANVSMNGVVSPAVNISHDDQEDLNVTTQGKSINAIRSFIGEGVLVWGARTLDGNSLDWRYINVRRTMIMLEESCRLASKAMVFEPNVANTWVTIKSMIANFLTGIWKRGGLAGAVPDDAFSVHVGLGETMTPEDILEGILRVTVLVAISRPAEFIEITFQQQMQKS